MGPGSFLWCGGRCGTLRLAAVWLSLPSASIFSSAVLRRFLLPLFGSTSSSSARSHAVGAFVDKLEEELDEDSGFAAPFVDLFAFFVVGTGTSGGVALNTP